MSKPVKKITAAQRAKIAADAEAKNRAAIVTPYKAVCKRIGFPYKPAKPTIIKEPQPLVVPVMNYGENVRLDNISTLRVTRPKALRRMISDATKR